MVQKDHVYSELQWPAFFCSRNYNNAWMHLENSLKNVEIFGVEHVKNDKNKL